MASLPCAGVVLVRVGSRARPALRVVRSTFLPTITAASDPVFPGHSRFPRRSRRAVAEPPHTPAGLLRGGSRERLSTAPHRDRTSVAETLAVHPLLRAAAERRLGVFTAADVRRAAYDHSEVRRLCSSGRWVRLRRGVYIAAEDLPATDDARARHAVECMAVLLHLGRPHTVVSHATAAALRGWPLPRDIGPTVRLTDPDRWRQGQGFAMSRAPLPAGDVVRRGPLRVTSAARTLVDCAREWPLEDAVVALDAALLAEHVTPEQLRHATATAAHWAGARRAVRAVELADGRAESPLETRGRLRILGSGLPTPELQVEIRVGGRLVAVVDGWFDDAAVAVEFDGRVKYTDPWRDRSPGRVLWEEKRREDALRGLDIGVVRIADADVGTAWPATEQRLRRLTSTPGPAERRFTVHPRRRGLRRSG